MLTKLEIVYIYIFNIYMFIAVQKKKMSTSKQKKAIQRKETTKKQMPAEQLDIFSKYPSHPLPVMPTIPPRDLFQVICANKNVTNSRGSIGKHSSAHIYSMKTLIDQFPLAPKTKQIQEHVLKIAGWWLNQPI